MNLKTKPIIPRRATMPYGGYTSCLPPIGRSRAPAPGPRPVIDFDNMSDEQLLQLEPAQKALLAHDWHFEFSDDASTRARGEAQRTNLVKLLKALEPQMARALWQMYAPAAMPFDLVVR